MAELARLEERLLAGEVPVEARPLLLEAVRHYRRCDQRRGAKLDKKNSGGQRKGRAKGQPRGHGRLSADDYTGAERVACSHDDWKVGDACPLTGCRGKLYPFRVDNDVELEAAPPVQATVYEREVLRCATCQTTFTAPLPDDAHGAKFHPSVDAVLAVLRYSLGMPHYRLAQWQQWAGVPLPPSTQFERAEVLADKLHPIYRRLVYLAANQALLFGDDTGARILELLKEIRHQPEGGRTGIFTTAMLARGLDGTAPMVALFASGRRHAGENLDLLFTQRRPDAPILIHMADAASRDPHFTHRIQARCIQHARRHFEDAREAFPEPCQHALGLIARVYRNDDETVAMTPQARLDYHRRHSAPLMTALREWIEEQFERRLVEPNGQLGKACRYVQNHWYGLTRFLEVPGVPLDNSPVEREIKTNIRHRKNSLFFKTQVGAAIGDLLLSVIRTCVLNHVDPVHYLTAVGEHAARARAAPDAWLPWTYRHTLAGVN